MKPIFRSSMFGFNKSDVFNFINKLNKQSEARVSELSAELQRQSADFEREREAFERDSSEIDSLKASLNEMKTLLTQVELVVSDILKDKAKLALCADTLRKEKSADQNKLAEMSARVQEAEKLREKAEKFDQLSGVLSSIFNQPEIENSVSEFCEDAVVSEDIPSESRSVVELVDLLAVLAVHCEKLQMILPREK